MLSDLSRPLKSLAILSVLAVAVPYSAHSEFGDLDHDAVPRAFVTPAASVPPPTATPDIVGPTPTGISHLCRSEAIRERQYEPDTYPQISVQSPYSTALSFTAVSGTLQFNVDMPTADNNIDHWTLGVDFDGYADICTAMDPETGMSYDNVTLHMVWAENSGGVYNVFYSYVPYVPGIGYGPSPIIVQNLYLVDAASGENGGANDCLDGASTEFSPNEWSRDLILSPWKYRKDANVFESRMAFEPGFQSRPTDFVDSVADMAAKINAAWRAKGERVNVVFDSHGWVDLIWLNTFSVFQGNNAEVRALGAAVRGQVATLYLHACCTAKGKTNGTTPNILDSLSTAMMPATGSTIVWTRVCGWNHMVFSWRRNGTYHIGVTRGDSLVCVI